jgi:hypothetical protein
MVYSGANKEAGELGQGDYISITSYLNDVSDVVSVTQVGDRVRVETSNGKTALCLHNTIFRLFI